MRVLVRLDDFTPHRNGERWEQVGAILDELAVRPLVAVVPDDRYFGCTPTTTEFWDSVRDLEAKGWSIGLHGETHLVTQIPAGARSEIPFATKSEFIGLTFEAQLEKLRRAWAIFAQNGVRPIAFVAPNHGFDRYTVEALRRLGEMKLVSDGVSWRIFRDRGLTWLPQCDWRIPRFGFGFRTVCLHPSTMTGREIDGFARAAAAARRSFLSVDEINLTAAPARGPSDLLFEVAFRLYLNTKSSLHRWSSPRAAEKQSASRACHD